MRFAIAFLYLVSAVPSFAQMNSKSAQSPLVDPPAKESKPKQKGEAAPLAQALDLAFGATTWGQIKISTAGPAVEVTRLVREGYYKLEIIQLVLMSAQGRKTFAETVEKRKKGEK